MEELWSQTEDDLLLATAGDTTNSKGIIKRAGDNMGT